MKTFALTRRPDWAFAPARVVALFCLLMALVASLGSTPAFAARGYIMGSTSYMNYFNCQTSGAERLTGTQIGYYGDTNGSFPRVGDVYYIRVDVSTLGNACSGVRARVEVHLPPSTQFAIDANNPVQAEYLDLSTSARTILGANEIVQNPYYGNYGSTFFGFYPKDAYGNVILWPIPRGKRLSVHIPVRSTQRLVGISTNSYLAGAIETVAGWDAPGPNWNGQTQPSTGPWQGVWVADRASGAPTISYSAPTNITNERHDNRDRQ